MEKTASQIAQGVLRTVDMFNRSLYHNVQQFKLAAEKKEPPLSLPATVTLGTGAGAATGAGYGLLSNLKNIKTPGMTNVTIIINCNATGINFYLAGFLGFEFLLILS